MSLSSNIIFIVLVVSVIYSRVIQKPNPNDKSTEQFKKDEFTRLKKMTSNRYRCYRRYWWDPRACSGHGSCVGHNKCICHEMYVEPDCSEKVECKLPTQEEWEMREEVQLKTEARGNPELEELKQQVLKRFFENPDNKDQLNLIQKEFDKLFEDAEHPDQVENDVVEEEEEEEEKEKNQEFKKLVKEREGHSFIGCDCVSCIKNGDIDGYPWHVDPQFFTLSGKWYGSGCSTLDIEIPLSEQTLSTKNAMIKNFNGKYNGMTFTDGKYYVSTLEGYPGIDPYFSFTFQYEKIDENGRKWLYEGRISGNDMVDLKLDELYLKTDKSTAYCKEGRCAETIEAEEFRHIQFKHCTY